MIQPLVFIAHSQADEAEKQQLLAHLNVLRQAGRLDLWSEARIPPGANREAALNAAVDQAKVAILLLSANFFSDEKLIETVVRPLLDRHAKNELTLIPLLARACAWQADGRLAGLEIFPKDRRPIWGSGEDLVDSSLSELARVIADVLKLPVTNVVSPKGGNSSGPLGSPANQSNADNPGGNAGDDPQSENNNKNSFEGDVQKPVKEAKESSAPSQAGLPNTPFWVWVLASSAIIAIFAGLVEIAGVSLRDVWAFVQSTATPTATQEILIPPTSTATPTLVFTNTPTHTPTETPQEVTTMPSPQPPTPTIEPTPAPEPTSTSTAVPLPPPTPTSTYTPSPTLSPTTLTVYPPPTLIEPSSTAESINGIKTFVWEWNGPELPETHGFEVRIWKDGEEHLGAHSAKNDNLLDKNIKREAQNRYSLTFNPSTAAAVTAKDIYFWTVAVVQLDPYDRSVGQEAAPFQIDITDASSSGGGGKETPTRAPP